MFYRILFPFIAASLVSLPLFSQEIPDEETDLGNFVFLKGGELAPFDGLLFDPEAIAKIISDTELKTFKMELEMEKSIKVLSADYQKQVDTLTAVAEIENDKYEKLLDIKDEEIGSLRRLVEDAETEDYTELYFVGGVLVGALLSVGIYFAAQEMK